MGFCSGAAIRDLDESISLKGQGSERRGMEEEGMEGSPGGGKHQERITFVKTRGTIACWFAEKNEAGDSSALGMSFSGRETPGFR